MIDQIGIKDIGYLLALATTIATFISRIRSVEEKTNRIMKALFQDCGTLNIITTESCKLSQNAIYTAIRRHENSVETLSNEIKQLNRNVLRIMIHLNIDTEK